MTYCVLCKVCSPPTITRGGSFKRAINYAQEHLRKFHRIRWNLNEDVVEEIEEYISNSEEREINLSLEGTTIIYAKDVKTWTVISPLIEVFPSDVQPRITREELIFAREVAKKLAEEEKEKRRREEEERKRRRKALVYKKRYFKYWFKYDIKDEGTRLSLTLFTSKTCEERAEYARLWSEYHSLKITSEDTPEFYKTLKELKKHRLHTQPLGKKDLEELRINYSLLCRKCPLKPICGLSRSARSLSREILVEEGCVLLQKLFAPSP